MSFSRQLRGAVLARMPGGLKSRLRRWHYLLTTRGSPVPLDLQPGDSCLEATVEGALRMRVPPETRADLETQFRGAEHAAEMRAFLRAIRKPGLFLDVGASNGFFACLFCLSHPDNRAVAFEPSKLFVDRMDSLRRLNSIEDRMTLVDKAAGGETGEAELLLDEEGGFVQSAQFPGTVRPTWRKLILRTTTLDAECARLQAAPTLLKIDIEGYEWEALRGARRILVEFKPEIFLELHLTYLEHRGVNPREVVAMLEGHGYEFWTLNDKVLAPNRICDSWSPVVRLIARRAA